MPRPPVCRRVLHTDTLHRFQPEPPSGLEPLPLARDGLEALRLADVLGYYQDRAAEQMGVSRATFARILEAARRTVAEALVKRRGLVIVEEAPVETYEQPRGCGCRRRRRMSAPGGPGCPFHPTIQGDKT